MISISARGMTTGPVLNLTWMRALVAPLLALLYSSLAACTAADKYRLVEQAVPAAQVMDIATNSEPLDLKLRNVIVTGGPGSWKLKALWDEYAVTLTNRGARPINVLSVRLIGADHLSRAPFDDPWRLESLSDTAWNEYGRWTLRAIGIGIESVALGTAAVLAGSSGIKPGPPSPLGKVAIAVGALGLIDLVVVSVADSNSREKIEAIFQRRRLQVPTRIDPRESIDGSFFFPVTLQPKRLVLLAISDEQPLELTLDLDPIAPMRQWPNK